MEMSIAHHSRGTGSSEAICALRIVRLPSAWALVSFTGGAVAIIGGIVASITVVALLAIITFAAARSRTVQNRIELMDRARCVRRRREHRARRLSRRAVPTAALHDLTRLVDAIDQVDPHAGSTFELDELLDHYVDVALARESATSALVTDCRASTHAHWPGERSVSLQAIQARRYEAFRAMRQREANCEQELAAIESFVRLLALRAAWQASAAVLDDSQIEDRLLRMKDDDPIAA